MPKQNYTYYNGSRIFLLFFIILISLVISRRACYFTDCRQCYCTYLQTDTMYLVYVHIYRLTPCISSVNHSFHSLFFHRKNYLSVAIQVAFQTLFIAVASSSLTACRYRATALQSTPQERKSMGVMSDTMYRESDPIVSRMSVRAGIFGFT